jgi:IS605 OrfB family transposase
MHTTYTYRIKDATTQKHLCAMARAVNFVWNYCNQITRDAWRCRRRWLTAYDLDPLLAGSSQLLPLHSQTIQAISKEHATRRNQFHKAKLRWRSNKHSLGWIPFKASGIRIDGDSITYQKKRFRVWLSRPLPSHLVLATGSFSQDACGHWYVHLQYKSPTQAEQEMQAENIADLANTSTPHAENATPPPSNEQTPHANAKKTRKKKPKVQRVLSPPPVLRQGNEEEGCDLGLKQLVTCASGQVYTRENLTKTHAEKLATAQRARKKKQTRKIHAKIANRRKDWIEKTTTRLVERCERLAVGDVSASKLKKAGLGKSVSDAAWGTWRRRLEEKAKTRQVSCVVVSEAYSSQTCHHCLERSGPRGRAMLGVRVWTCSGCGMTHDRDQNAAKNIFRFAYGRLPSG